MKSFNIKSRIWIENDNLVLVGNGRVQLLEAVQNEGSLSKAAKSLKMSYKKAWDLINSINSAGEYPVVILQVGGRKGGRAQLTEYGEALILAYKQVEHNCWKFLKQQESIINNIK